MTWEYLGKIDDRERGTVLVTHPLTPTIMLTGFDRTYYQGGIYLSEDAGETWVSVLPYLYIYDIEIDPRNSNTIYAASLSSVASPSPPAGIYRSEDAGKTWEYIYSRCN